MPISSKSVLLTKYMFIISVCWTGITLKRSKSQNNKKKGVSEWARFHVRRATYLIAKASRQKPSMRPKKENTKLSTFGGQSTLLPTSWWVSVWLATFSIHSLPTFKLLFKLTSKELVYLIPVRLEFQNFFPKNASILILFWRLPTFCTSYHINLNGWKKLFKALPRANTINLFKLVIVGLGEP